MATPSSQNALAELHLVCLTQLNMLKFVTGAHARGYACEHTKSTLTIDISIFFIGGA